MEYEVIIHGKVSTKNVDKFKECFFKALTDSESTFRGNTYVYEFTEYEEVKDDTES